MPAAPSRVAWHSNSPTDIPARSRGIRSRGTIRSTASIPRARSSSSPSPPPSGAFFRQTGHQCVACFFYYMAQVWPCPNPPPSTTASTPPVDGRRDACRLPGVRRQWRRPGLCLRFAASPARHPHAPRPQSGRGPCHRRGDRRHAHPHLAPEARAVRLRDERVTKPPALTASRSGV